MGFPSIFTSIFALNNIKLVQISTDHFITSDQNRKHKENSKIKILNTYAKTKFLAEKYTKHNKNHIIIRTNFTGYRNKTNNQTFIEWLLDNFKKKSFYLFDDFYCSTIDVKSLSNIIFDLIDLDFKGTVNIGNSLLRISRLISLIISNNISFNLRTPGSSV